MWNKCIPVVLLVAAHASTLCCAQNPVWCPDVANIIYDHCSSCHHQGSIGPFELMSYSDVVDNGLSVQEQVGFRHMPPWPADPDYRHFAHENVLTQAEIDAVVDWVNFGAPFGDPGLEPAPPVFPAGGSLLDTIDFQVAIPPYTLQYNTDEYRWFVIENPFPTTVYVNAIEVFPGLDSVVHHADISYDNTGASLANDLADPLPGFNSNTGSPTYSFYMNAWQPGGNLVRYPPQWGIALPPNADFVLEIHYGPGNQGLVDSTVMNLEFVTGGGVRPVNVGWLLGNGNMTDGPLVIPANTVRTFHHEYTVPSNRSFVSICPHMHHVGVSFKVWYEYAGDSIPLIDIPRWDFHWQRYYTFQQVQPIPAGAVIKSEGVYDNTMNNADNPNNPPQTIGWGATTADEMFLCYFIWATYQQGDENIVLDSTLYASVPSAYSPIAEWSVFPNPTEDLLTVDLPGISGERTDLQLTDATGRLVRMLDDVRPAEGGARFSLAGLPAGIYNLQIVSSAMRASRKVVKD
ncbi:MAG: T9SS type A sorting domain-containing protein [Flavobacteriales bacterium]